MVLLTAMSVDFFDVLAAHKGPFLAAMEIFPLVGGELLQAILVESVWLSSIPERESPKTTICPLPSALLFSASASQIEILYSAFFHLCAQKGVEMLRIHRGRLFSRRIVRQPPSLSRRCRKRNSCPYRASSLVHRYIVCRYSFFSSSC